MRQKTGKSIKKARILTRQLFLMYIEKAKTARLNETIYKHELDTS